MLTTAPNADAIAAVVAVLGLAGGLIAWLLSRRSPAEPIIAADHCGVATTGTHSTTVAGKTGGSIINAPVTNSTITAGLSADEVARLMQAPQAERDNLVRATAEAQRDLGSTVTLVQAFLRTILDRDVPPDQFAATLMELAGSWKAAGERIEAKRGAANLFPEVEALRQQAEAAYRAERLDEVEALLAETDRRETAALAELTERLAVQQASNVTTKQGRVEVALSRGDAEGAARLIAEIVALETPEPARFEALRARFIDWYERGRDRGLNLDLKVAIALARAALDVARGPDQRGAGLNDVGNALRSLGARESDPATLRDAVTAYRQALEDWTRDRVPLDWAMTQNNLGNALLCLGEREGDTATLRDAVTAYRQALEEYTRERTPLDWAMSTGNQGVAMARLAALTGDCAMAEAAVAQITAARDLFRDVGHASDTAVYDARLPKAEGIRDRLSRR